MRRISVIALLSLSLATRADVNPEPIVRYADLDHPVYGTAGMVASQNGIASQVGAEILAEGGSAVDAAVAVGFALAVTLPRAGNLGGGGFMLIHDADADKTEALDYREMAPPGATHDMFIGEDGNVDNRRARFSHLSAGVPGTVAGFWAAHQRYGRLDWERLLEPAIALAEEGFRLNFDMSETLRRRQERLCANPAACAYYFKADGSAYQPGETLRQADLAATLTRIAEHGRDGFYAGETAAMIARDMRVHGGLIDRAALAAYKPVWREPLSGTYRNSRIVTMPPPSSGGVHILQMLNVLERFDVASMGSGSADNVHLLAEVMRLAFADRSKHLGDPDYYPVPVGWLTGKTYGRQLAETIDLAKARASDDVLPGVAPAPESPDTTHYSIMDSDGNVVSNTYTLNLSYGSGIAVEGAGFLLNNEMDDFVAKPGVPNAYGMLGSDANAIAGGKRPLSSMTPTIVFAGGEPWFATGSPGGSRIITTVLQVIVNVVDHGMNIAEASAAPRMHHQWYPDLLQLESGYSPDTVRLLEAKGHAIRGTSFSMGSLQSVAYRDGVFRGASDPRRPNALSVAVPTPAGAAE
ncbi:MAG: gamma-glutamyltransferase [Pseudomonadota bacterium]